LTPGDISDVRNSLASHLAALMIRAGLVSKPSEVTVRDGLPTTDFTQALYPAPESWRTPAAGVLVSTWTAMVNAPLGNSKFMAFYGVYNEQAIPTVVATQFRLGANGVTFQVQHLQQLYSEQEAVGYFADPIIFAPNDTVWIGVYCRTALGAVALPALGEPIGFKCLVAERIGVTAAGQQQPV
jgi:hypothetical protein